MAEISLRAYVREIDDLIEHGQLDEAIAHARAVLQTYPRHLETYRLLGKAYLEAKRYGDSADILQRVLSAVPDDFVAHVGMSIVREDEGNLDAAIWHMERAFETSPSNAAVQGELRRLIGKRDGLEPPKVRLTRGALARMYAHGELYPQAIAELRAALNEDPDRPDLQVLLADMYWRTNQRNEAGEVASAILEVLPNCREANRILAAALHAEGRTEEALTYHRRVAALDPYTALVDTILDDPARVDANAVRIEKLTWQPGQPLGRDTGPAEWGAEVPAQSRASAGSAPSAPRPSWLDSIGAATAARARASGSSTPPVESETPAEPAPPAAEEAVPDAGGQIPDWMQAAGWSPGMGEAKEEPISFSDDELRSLEAGQIAPEPAPEPEGGLVPAQIPDWLQDVAPAAAGPGESDEPAAAPASAEFEASGLEAPRLPPGWSPPAGASEEDDDWLKAAADDAPALPTWMEEDAPGATATIVTWLGDRPRGGGAPASQPEPAVETPAPAPQPEPQLARAELPEWLASEAPIGGTPDEGETPPAAPPAAPSWLSGVAEAAAKGSSIEPDEVSWQPESESPIVTGMYPEDEVDDEAPAPADLPDWLQTIAGSSSATRSRERVRESEPQEEEAPVARGAQVPRIGDSGSFDWLRELAEAEPPTPGASEAPQEADSAAPSWMSASRSDESSRTALGRSAGPEWLRGIAEPEEPAAARSEAASMDWLRGISEAAPEEAIEPAGDAAFETAGTPETAGADESAEWVNLLSTSDSSTEPAGSTGEWLRLLKRDGVPSPEAPSEPAPVAPAVPAGELDDDQVFDWLESLAAKQGIPAPEQIQTPPAFAAAPQAPPPAPRPLPEEPEAGLAWLEELAAEQGPAAPSETPSMQQLEAPQESEEMAAPAPAEVPPPSAPLPGPEVPEWLKQLVAEPPRDESPQPEPAAEPIAPGAETWPALPTWMVSQLPGEEEPTAPPLPAIEKAQAAPEPEPIDELADTWVPPWETMQIEESAEESSVEPGAETVVSKVEETLEATLETTPVAAEPAEPPTEAEPPAPRYQEPTTDVLGEVPEWLRTQAPRQPAVPEEPALAAAELEEPEPEESEIPDWLTLPVTPVAVEPIASEPPIAEEPPVVPAPAEETLEPAPASIVPLPPPAPEPPRAVEPEPLPEAAPLPVETPSAAEVRAVPSPVPAAAPKPKHPVPVPQTKGHKPGLEDRLTEARHALATGDYRRAAGDYAAVIKKKYQLEEVIGELEIALDRNPKAASLWQVLGDAYMKADRLSEAISAYERGVAAA